MPQKMVDVSTRQIVEVPDEEVLQHFQSGKFAFEQGQKLDVTNAYGDTGTIDAKEFGKAFGSKKYTFQTPEELHQKELEKQYGGIGGTAAAAGEGLARGLTVGLSDPLAIAGAKALYGQETAEKVRTHLRGEQETHPYVSTGTEVLGMVAPLIASGGTAEAGLVARAGAEGVEGAGLLGRFGRGLVTGTEVLGAPSKGIAAAGDLAEKAVAAIVGDGAQSTVGKLAQKALSRGASDAVQTALMNVGHEISESSLGDHKLAADKLWSAVGHGLMFGGGFGLATGAGGVLAHKAATSAIEHVSPLLKRTAEEQAVKSLSYGGLQSTRAFKSMERLPGKAEGVGREVLDSKILEAGDTFEHIAPKVGAAKEEAGAALSSTLKILDGKGARLPELGEIEARIIKDAEKELGTLRNLNEAGFTKLDKAVSDVREHFGDTPFTLEGLRDFRSKLDKQINFTRAESAHGTVSAPLEALLSARRTLEKVVEETADKEGSRLGLGSDVLDIYKAQKLRYQRLSIAEDLVQDSLPRATKNATFGLGEKAMLAAEMAGGLAMGHPIAGLALGVGSALAGKVIRERGNATAAVLLDKVGSLASVRTSIKQVDRRIAEGVERFFDGRKSETKVLRPLSKADRTSQYEEAVRNTRAASDPKAVAAYTESHLGSLRHVAPRIAAAFQQTASTAALYALSRLPKEQTPISFQPQFAKKTKVLPDPYVQDKFLREYRVLTDPASVVDDMASGTLSYEAVQTLKIVNRPLYDDIGKRLHERAIDPNAKPMKTDQLIQGSIFFGRPLTDWMKPSAILGSQNAYQSGAPSPGTAPPSKGAGKSTPKSFDSAIASPTKLSGFGGKI